MNAPLLAGIFGAWTAVQVALGAFFLFAYFARTKDREYLLFGLLCFALAVTDAGLTLSYAATGMAGWARAGIIATLGGIASAALNTHFVLTYASARLNKRLIAAAYAMAAFFAAATFGAWFEPGSFRVVLTRRLGVDVAQIVATPTPLAAAFFAAVVVVHGALGVLLARSYRAGKREALSTLIGFIVASLCMVNDILVATGQLQTVFLGPYGFLIYGFGVARTLLVRYRDAAEKLEATATDLFRTTAELRTSYSELRGVQAELFRRRQLASVGELAAAIAHEVRNPLAIIANAVANLRRRGLLDEDRTTLFGIIEEETSRLNGLVTELLRYARPVSVQRTDVAIGEILRDIGSALDTRYVFDCDAEDNPSAQTAWVDPSLLRLALDNLVDNACQSMPEGGRIAARVEPESDGNAIRIEITDQGHGMDQPTLDRATDPFFTTRPRGTGLGLPIVARIVEAHDGYLQIESAPSKGTTVRLVIPGRQHNSAVAE